MAAQVFNDPIQPPANPEEAALVALLSAPDAYLEEVLAATREGRALPPPPAAGPLPQSKIPPRSRFIFSLEQERRPPLEGCWLLKELYHMKKTAFQKLNEVKPPRPRLGPVTAGSPAQISHVHVVPGHLRVRAGWGGV